VKQVRWFIRKSNINVHNRLLSAVRERPWDAVYTKGGVNNRGHAQLLITEVTRKISEAST